MNNKTAKQIRKNNRYLSKHELRVLKRRYVQLSHSEKGKTLIKF